MPNVRFNRVVTLPKLLLYPHPPLKRKWLVKKFFFSRVFSDTPTEELLCGAHIVNFGSRWTTTWQYAKSFLLRPSIQRLIYVPFVQLETFISKRVSLSFFFLDGMRRRSQGGKEVNTNYFRQSSSALTGSCIQLMDGSLFIIHYRFLGVLRGPTIQRNE